MRLEGWLILEILLELYFLHLDAVQLDFSEIQIDRDKVTAIITFVVQLQFYCFLKCVYEWTMYGKKNLFNPATTCWARRLLGLMQRAFSQTRLLVFEIETKARNHCARRHKLMVSRIKDTQLERLTQPLTVQICSCAGFHSNYRSLDFTKGASERALAYPIAQARARTATYTHTHSNNSHDP